jgi:hypothetical protein
LRAGNVTLGEWFNRRRFDQRRAKGYALSKRFDHRLSRWLSGALFKLLPPEWYLRTQGIKLCREPPATATVTYLLQEGVLSRKKQAQVKFGSAYAIIKVLPLWFGYGFCEPVPELSPYIPRHLDSKRYYIPPALILRVEWYDPVLKDTFSIDGSNWRLNGNNSDAPIG